MAYVKTVPKYMLKAKFRVGDHVVTKKKVRCQDGYFEKGTRVKVVGISPLGYNLEDAQGNEIRECGFRCIEWEEK